MRQRIFFLEHETNRFLLVEWEIKARKTRKQTNKKKPQQSYNIALWNFAIITLKDRKERRKERESGSSLRTLGRLRNNTTYWCGNIFGSQK